MTGALLLMQAERRPGALVGNVMGGVLRMVTYGVFFSVLVLLGSAVLRRAAATGAGGNGLGIAATPSLPGSNGASNYAPKEYNKVPHPLQYFFLCFLIISECVLAEVQRCQQGCCNPAVLHFLPLSCSHKKRLDSANCCCVMPHHAWS